jgi:hypothetical protein
MALGVAPARAETLVLLKLCLTLMTQVDAAGGGGATLYALHMGRMLMLND